MDSAEVLSRLELASDAITELTCRLVAAASENPPGDERQITGVILDELKTRGLHDVEVVGPSPERPSIICRVRGGSSGRTLLYNGHTDTKPVGDRSAWATDPFMGTIRDGRIFGLGASDMKGGIASLIFATEVVNEHKQNLSGDLLLVLNADEEAGGSKGAGHIVAHHRLNADVALIAEGSGITREWEFLGLLARGVCCFRIKVSGTQMHSSVSDIVPSTNAVEKMAWVITRMARDLKVSFSPHPLCPQGPTFAPGVMVRGGVFYGVLPGQAEFSSDIRVLPGMEREQLIRDIEDFLAGLRSEDKSLDVKLEVEPQPLGWKDAFEVPSSEPFVEDVLAAAQMALGTRPPLGALPGWTDSIWYQGTGGIPTIPAFGPGLITAAHSPNESVSAHSLVQASQIYALAALRYLGWEGR